MKTKYVSEKRIENRWITTDVKRTINEKSEFLGKYRRGVITHEENNRKKQLGKLINKAKTDFYPTTFNSARNDSNASGNF